MTDKVYFIDFRKLDPHLIDRFLDRILSNLKFTFVISSSLNTRHILTPLLPHSKTNLTYGIPCLKFKCKRNKLNFIYYLLTQCS